VTNLTTLSRDDLAIQLYGDMEENQMENKKEKFNYNKVPKKEETKVEFVSEELTKEELTKEEPKKETPKVKLGFVNNSYSLNLREEPRKDAKILTVMPPKSRVEVLEDAGEFIKIKFNEFEGFAMKQFITVK